MTPVPVIPHVVGTDTALAPAVPPEHADRESSGPRSLRKGFGRDDAAELLASIGAGTSLAWITFTQVLPLTGTAGFLINAYVASMVVYAIVQRQRHGKLAASDRVVTALVGSLGAVIVAVLFWIIISVAASGLRALRSNFFTEDLATVGPYSSLDEGGALHSIVGSFEQVALAMVLAVPLAMFTAVFLNEVGGRLAAPVRTLVTALSGLPSILAGLFVAVFWVDQLDSGFSGFAGSIALAIMMLPAVTRTSEEVLRLVPGGLREASLALGAPEWRSTWKVVLPTARTGLTTAVLLGAARAVGEAAPLLPTTFGSTKLNLNPFDGPQDSLPFLIWQSYRNASNNVVDRGWTAALVLLLIVLVLFAAARTLGSRPIGSPGLSDRIRRYRSKRPPAPTTITEGPAA